MQVKIEFYELQSLVRQKTGREIVLSAVDGRTVRVEAKVKVRVPLLGEMEKNRLIGHFGCFLGVFFGIFQIA